MEIGLHYFLHVCRLVVEVAHAVPAFASVVVGRELVAVFVGPSERGSAVVVAADVGRVHLIGHALIGLDGEVDPV